MTATMTEKQRQAVAAMEAARSQGCSLSDYAKAKGLDVRRIFAILTMLRRRGLLLSPIGIKKPGMIGVMAPVFRWGKRTSRKG